MYDSITVETDPVRSISVETSIKQPDRPMIEGVGEIVEGDVSLSENTDDDNMMDDADDDLDEEMDLDD
jgi:hypothetical protein